MPFQPSAVHFELLQAGGSSAFWAQFVSHLMGQGACARSAASSSDAARWEDSTSTQVSTTTPAWHEEFWAVVQDASHLLRVIAVHDAQKGGGTATAAWCVTWACMLLRVE